MDRLAIIQQCIVNDINAIKELEYHLKKLYEMRDNELRAQGIDKEEWEQAVKELLEDAKA